MHEGGGCLALPFTFVIPEKKVDLSETFKPLRCLGFIFVQYLQGNSRRDVKQGTESKATLSVSESASRGFAFALHFL